MEEDRGQYVPIAGNLFEEGMGEREEREREKREMEDAQYLGQKEERREEERREEERREEEEEEEEYLVISFLHSLIGKEKTEKMKRIISLSFGAIVIGFFVCLTIIAISIDFMRALPLLILELIVLLYHLFFLPPPPLLLSLLPSFLASLSSNLSLSLSSLLSRRFNLCWRSLSLSYLLKCFIAIVCVLGVGFEVIRSIGEEPSRSQALLGCVLLPLSCFLFSRRRSYLNFKQICGGLALQYLLGILFLRIGYGFQFVEFIGDVFIDILDNLKEGVEFVFGETLPELAPFAFIVLPTIAFVSSLVSILQYMGVLQAVIKVFGRFMQMVIGVTSAEALSVVSNVFIGQSETPLIIRSLLSYMTISEFHVLITGGFATVSGSALAAYIEMGNSPPFLLSASVMAAPGALALSKILLPESSPITSDYYLLDDIPSSTLPPRTTRRDSINEKEKDPNQSTETDQPLNLIPAPLSTAPSPPTPTTRRRRERREEGEEERDREEEEEGEEEAVNVFQAAMNGAIAAIPVMGAIATTLFCFISLFSFLNQIVNWLGDLVDVGGVSLELIFGYVFFPVAFILGTPINDCLRVGELLTLKLFLNEFVAFEELVKMRDEGEISQKADVIATFALCGFANFASVGIQLGILTVLQPKRKEVISRNILTALFGGYCTSLLSASIACLMGANMNEG